MIRESYPIAYDTRHREVAVSTIDVEFRRVKNGQSLNGHFPSQLSPETEVSALGTFRGKPWRNCTVNRTLLPNKMFYLFFFAGLSAILPYLSIFLKMVGLSPEQIGIISGLRPIVGCLGAPLLGYLGDRYGIRRWIFLVSIAAYLAFYFAMYHIPPPARIQECPDNVPSHRLYDFTVHSTDEVDSGNNQSALNSSQYDNIVMLTEHIGWIYNQDQLNHVFVLVISLILCGEIFQSPTTALSDAATLRTLGSSGLHSYGSQRAWGAIGWGTCSFLAGAVVSSSRHKEVICGVELYFSDYRLLTYVFIGFLVLGFVAATQIKFKEGKNDDAVELTGAEVTPKSADSSSNASSQEKGHNALAVVKLFLNMHYGSWLFTTFYVGVCNGLIWGFLYWHLDNLGADQMLLGVAGTVLCLSEFIMFFLVGKLIKVLGHMGIMYIGLVGYAVRFCVYAVIKNPWWVLPAEVLQGVTFSSVWVSMTAYTTLAVPSASLATIQGILHGVYFGLGNGTGHLIGGLMIGYFGAVITFFSFAASCIVVLIFFVIAQKIGLWYRTL